MGGLYGNAAATALEDCPEAARGLMSGILQQGVSFLITAYSSGVRLTTNLCFSMHLDTYSVPLLPAASSIPPLTAGVLSTGSAPAHQFFSSHSVSCFPKQTPIVSASV